MSNTDDALMRLQANRERIHALFPPPPSQSATGWSSSQRDGLRRLLARARRSLRAPSWLSPWLAAPLRAAETWWQRQPLSAPAEVLATELGTELRGLVHKHPLLAAAAAAGTGAALVWFRPWRHWRTGTAMLGAQALPTLQRWGLRLIGRPELQAALLAAAHEALASRPPAGTTADRGAATGAAASEVPVDDDPAHGAANDDDFEAGIAASVRPN